jgi:hypothetical protein
MHIEITNDALILIGVLSLILLPQIHLILIFSIYAIIEEFGKLCAKIIKFTFNYIIPLMSIIFFIKAIIFVYNNFNPLCI